jgi:hypothetical protein
MQGAIKKNSLTSKVDKKEVELVVGRETVMVNKPLEPRKRS